jgi:hypothetical protein
MKTLNGVSFDKDKTSGALNIDFIFVSIVQFGVFISDLQVVQDLQSKLIRYTCWLRSRSK